MSTGQSSEERLHEYLDGGIAESDESMLFNELSLNPSLRQQLTSFITIRQALVRDSQRNALRPEMTAQLMATLGYPNPLVTPSSDSRHTGIGSSTASGAARIIGIALIAGLLFISGWTMHDVSMVPEDMRVIVNAVPEATRKPLLYELHYQNQQSVLALKSIQEELYSSRKEIAFLKHKLLRQQVTSKKERRVAIDQPGASQQMEYVEMSENLSPVTPYLSSVSHYDLTSFASAAPRVERIERVGFAALSTGLQEDSPFVKGFEMQVGGSNARLAASSTVGISDMQNARFASTVYYRLTSEHAVGATCGYEPFPRVSDVQKNVASSLQFYLGGAYRYSATSMSDVVYPAFALNVAGCSGGVVTKLDAAICLRPLAAITVFAGISESALFYSHNSDVLSSRRSGFSYGIIVPL